MDISQGPFWSLSEKAWDFLAEYFLWGERKRDIKVSLFEYFIVLQIEFEWILDVDFPEFFKVF